MLKKQSNFRLTGVARKLLAKLAEEMGVSVAGALEIVIREAAKKRGIKASGRLPK